MNTIIVRMSDATDDDYALAQKLVTYMDAQIQEWDPQEWHILSACVSHTQITVMCKDGYKETQSIEQALYYIGRVDYARAHGTGAYY